VKEGREGEKRGKIWEFSGGSSQVPGSKFQMI